MSIDDCYLFVQNLYNKAQQGNISPAQFNNFAPIAQEWIINELLGQDQRYNAKVPVPTYGLGLDQKTMEDLRPIITTPSALVFSSGIATYPVDSVYLFDLAETSGGKEILPCQVDEGRILNQSVIKPPIVGSGRYYVLGANIYVLPSSIVNTLITYVRKPVTPVWGFTYVNSIPTYDAGTSQDFELGRLMHLRICSRILQMAGVNLSLDQVVQYAQTMEAQGA